MVKIKAFRGVRPVQAHAQHITCRPYDVLSSEEAREEATLADELLANNGQSLYHVTRPEINFEEGTGEHEERVYGAAEQMYAKFKQEGWLRQDVQECYYLYAQTWRGKTQYGLMVAASVEDYENGRIRRHELTRKDKEDDRMRHVQACNANLGSAFFAYPPQEELRTILRTVAEAAPEYDFCSGDIRHQMWPIADAAVCRRITDIFASIPYLYIADGHHRSAAAARVGAERRAANPSHTGEEEYNYFLATCFSADELTILDYNRLVLDLNGHTEEEILDLVRARFDVLNPVPSPYHPESKHYFAMYLGGKWYGLRAKADGFNESDPIDSLDVSISSKYILKDIFGIEDLRTDKRIEFVGGIRGIDYLQEQVDNGKAKLALALYPVSMEDIMRVADAGEIMPPKATWFEPKLRTGIVIHELD